MVYYPKLLVGYYYCLYRRTSSNSKPERGIFVKHFRNIPMADMEIVLVSYFKMIQMFVLCYFYYQTNYNYNSVLNSGCGYATVWRLILIQIANKWCLCCRRNLYNIYILAATVISGCNFKIRIIVFSKKLINHSYYTMSKTHLKERRHVLLVVQVTRV